MKGELGSCDGPLNIEGGDYLAHLKTIGEVTCSALVSLSARTDHRSGLAGAEMAAGGIRNLARQPAAADQRSPRAGLQGALTGGPFASRREPLGGLGRRRASPVGPSCGVASGKRKAKAVKSGSFSTSAVQIEPH